MFNEGKWVGENISFKIYRVSIGRPLNEFSTSSDQTKRKRTVSLRNAVSTEELIYAAQMSLRATGKKKQADIVRAATSYPEISENLTSSDTKSLISALTALSMIIEAKLIDPPSYNIFFLD